MSDIKKLYDYQIIDMKLETEMENLKNTEVRKRLQKVHNYLRKQQSSIKKLEQNLIVKQNDVRDVVDQIESLQKKCELLAEEINQAATDDVENVDVNYVKDLVAEQEGQIDVLQKNKKSLDLIIKASDSAEEKLKTVLVNVAKAKKEWAELKKKHDLEIEEAQPVIDEINDKLRKAEKAVNVDLIEKYNTIKSNITPAIAVVSDGKCLGCNMEIPSSRLSKIHSGAILECESCGRILYLKDS